MPTEAQKSQTPLSIESIAAPFAGLLLILILVLLALRQQEYGVRIVLLHLPTKDYQCGDGRPVVVHWGVNHALWINNANVGEANAPYEVRRIMESRAERILIVIPPEDSPVQDVMESLNRLQNAIDDLHVGLITNSQYRASFVIENGFRYSTIGCAH